MLNKIFTCFFIFISISTLCFAQGPGGVGDNTTLKLWLKADDLSLNNGDPVANWPDASGNGNDASQVLGANQPTFSTNVINGKPAVSFDGINDYLTGSLGALNSPFTIIIVGYFDNVNQPAGDYDYLINLGNGTPNANVSMSRWASDGSNNNKYYVYNGSAVYYGPVLNGNQWLLLSAVHKTSAPRNNLFIDGTAQTVNDYPAFLNTNGSYTLGRFGPYAMHYLYGKIAEVIVYNYALNSAERTLVENYLSEKYNLSISNDKYSNTAGYSFDLRGIGKENDGTHTPSKTSKGLELIDAGYLQDNGDYVLFAHNTNSISEVNTDLPAYHKARWSRIWFLDFNDVSSNGGNITFKFDLSESGLGGAPFAQQNYTLLYRAGTSGIFSVIDSSASVSGDQISFTVNVNSLSDGYFTLGRRGPLTITKQIKPANFGSISGPTSVDYGNNVSFTIAPAPGTHIGMLLDNNSPKGAITSYTINYVMEDHTIIATFGYNASMVFGSPDIIVNEWSQGASANQEWIELLVVGDTTSPNVDLRGYKILANVTSPVSSAPTYYIEFTNNSMWSSVQRGSIIVLYNGNNKDASLPADDFSLSGDFKVVIPHNNSTYFNVIGTGVWNNTSNEFFNNLNVNDYPIIFDNEWIPNFDWGYQGPGVAIHPGTGQLAYYTSYYGNWGNPNYWEVTLSTSGYPARDNGGDNLIFVNAMRLNRPSIQIIPPASPVPSESGTQLNFTIKFGTEIPVYNVVGVSFKFRRGWQYYFKLTGAFYSAPSQSLFASGSAFVDTTTESGVINFAAIRNNNSETYTGTGGTITTLPLVIVQDLPNAANVNFFLTDVYTLDNNGEYIPLTQVTYQYNLTFLSSSGGNMIYRVGKGDSDHDGDVDLDDVSALALRFGEQGGAVQGIINWNTCSVITRDPWGVDAGRNPATDVLAVWCDHNGDGRVGNLDILQIGFCWSSTYSYSKKKVENLAESNSKIKYRIRDSEGKLVSKFEEFKEYSIELYIDELNGAQSINFILDFNSNLIVLDYKVSEDLISNSKDFIQFIKNDGNRFYVALAKPVYEGTFNGANIELIRFRVKYQQLDNNLIVINDPKLMDSNGNFYNLKFDSNLNNSLPDKFELSQNYPNPFNPSTIISFALPEASRVTLIIYNSIGEEISKLISNEFFEAGTYTKEFNAANLSNGIYFYRLISENYTAIKKMVLLK